MAFSFPGANGVGMAHANAAVQQRDKNRAQTWGKYSSGTVAMAGKSTAKPGLQSAIGAPSGMANLNLAGSRVPMQTALTPGVANPQADMDRLRQDIMNSHKNAWGGIESGVNANTALNQRRAAEMSAGMGRSIAGGFGGMMAQAMLGGQQNMLNARLGHEREGRGLQMDFLDQQIREKERVEDLEAQAASQPRLTGNQWAYQQFQTTGKYPTADEIRAYFKSNE